MQYADQKFAIEGRKLLTDEGSASIRYIQRIDDPAQYDSCFVTVFALMLAIEMAYPLTQNRNTQASLIKELEDIELPSARSADAAEGSQQKLITSTWVDSRSTGTLGGTTGGSRWRDGF